MDGPRHVGAFSQQVMAACKLTVPSSGRTPGGHIWPELHGRCMLSTSENLKCQEQRSLFPGLFLSLTHVPTCYS